MIPPEKLYRSKASPEWQQLAVGAKILRVALEKERDRIRDAVRPRRIIRKAIDALIDVEIELGGCDIDHESRRALGFGGCYRCHLVWESSTEPTG